MSVYARLIRCRISAARILGRGFDDDPFAHPSAQSAPMLRLRSTIIAILACTAIGSEAMGRQCQQPDNGNGTIDLPPAFAPECPYQLTSQATFIVNGLPLGTTIELSVASESATTALVHGHTDRVDLYRARPSRTER